MAYSDTVCFPYYYVSDLVIFLVICCNIQANHSFFSEEFATTCAPSAK